MNLEKFASLPKFAMAAVAVASLIGCSSEQRVGTAAAPETVSGVAVMAVHKTTVPGTLEAIGTVRAAQTAQVSSQMMGTIREIRAQEGDRVSAGQVLATIDDAQPRAAVEQASAAVTAAQKEVAAAETYATLAATTLKRYQQLLDRKSVSPQEFDEVQARSQAAESRRDMAKAGEAQASAALAQAKSALGYATIRAPFDGIITEKRADAGAIAAPGMPLFTLEDTRHYRLETTVDEMSIRMARMGENVSISLDSLGGAEFSGKVEQIVPAADPASRSFLVKIGLPAEARLHSGLFGRARFSLGAREALYVPQAAVVTRGQLQGVYAVDANRTAQLRYVAVGKTSNNQIEILSGLADGETIVAAPGAQDLGGKQIAAKP